MAATAASFKQADVSRAIKAATKAGMKVGRVEIDPATSIIVVVAAAEKPEPQNDLDRWLGGRAG